MTETSHLSQLAELQEILCCPRTKSDLSLITVSELLKRLPRDEQPRVPEGTTGAFVSNSSLTAYPIVGRVIDFLEQDSLSLAKDGGRPAAVDGADSSILESVKSWYDEFGWQRNESGIYNDTAMFSQVTLTAHGFYELSSHLSLLNRLSGGKFVLDAASGPIANPGMLAYSWFYRYHVCVDVSLTALREAEAKLAGKGFCCKADICRLPFRDGVFDGAVSGYTIQHIADSRQARAVEELYRVLKPGARLCVISGVTRTRAHRALVRAVRGIIRALRLLPAHSSLGGEQSRRLSGSPAPPHELYSYMHDLAWWHKHARTLTNTYSVEGLRLFNKAEFESLFGDSRPAAKAVRALETLFPKTAARMCAYILVDLCKAKG
jgi:SAM-dependent methyltransferase/uncharacterized protein YbaR (Trm112 family)